jgi:hypothetical protein
MPKPHSERSRNIPIIRKLEPNCWYNAWNYLITTQNSLDSTGVILAPDFMRRNGLYEEKGAHQ